MNRSNTQLNRCDEKSTDRPRVRDAHFALGTDAEGIMHHRSLVDEAVYWIDCDSGTVVRRLVVEDGRVDDYVDAIETERGWGVRQYGVSLVEQLIELYEKQERARNEVTA